MLLDRVAASPTELGHTLVENTNGYLAEREESRRFDCRYYMVKYLAMRENSSSTYYAGREEGTEHAVMDYSVCMLRAGGRALNGWSQAILQTSLVHRGGARSVLAVIRIGERGPVQTDLPGPAHTCPPAKADSGG